MSNDVIKTKSNNCLAMQLIIIYLYFHFLCDIFRTKIRDNRGNITCEKRMDGKWRPSDSSQIRSDLKNFKLIGSGSENLVLDGL